MRPEDAYNRPRALAYLARQDYQNARGYAELLIDDRDRKELVRHIASTMPSEHQEYERYWKARHEQRLQAAAEWRKSQAKKERGHNELGSE